ncbi:hypothetical protein LMF32_00820 [Desemzia sp. C1]|uniref:hypothetical protein n=1 Tax=Desemzia sp. C1 TaxID=2892016 RepID=UPI001E39F77B|nr:hypothetical protein [Desemzia sp. C1]MCI3027678.1 hypothetical protein [Desemzia sp. C1]
MLKKMLNMIPEAFSNLPESNFGKIFVLIEQQLTKVKETAQTIEEWHDMDLAKGATLNKIGDDYEVIRGSDDDYLYRFRIKSKIATAQSNGTYDEIINVICKTVNADPKDVSVIAYENEPLAIQVEKVPIDYFNDTGIKISSFVDSVRAAVAAGVRVESIIIESPSAMEIQHKRTIYTIKYGAFSGDGTFSGEFPYEILKADINNNKTEIEQSTNRYLFDIPLTGETPYEIKLGQVVRETVSNGLKTEAFVIHHPLNGEEPNVNKVGDFNDNIVSPGIYTKPYAIEFKFSGEDDF